MNKRTREMLRLLAQRKEPVTVEELAGRFGVSERTIRNDIGTINDLLRQRRCQEVTVGKNGAVQTGSDIEKTLEWRVEEDIYCYRLSKEERVDLAMALLLNAEPSITVQELSRQLQVSRATATGTLGAVRRKLEQRGLRAASYSNKGLFVEGLESRKREVLCGLLLRLSDTSRAGAVRLPHYPGLDFHRMLPPEERRTLCRIINEQEHLHSVFFSDSSFAWLQCCLMVVLVRVRQGMRLEPQPMAETRYLLARDLLSCVAKTWDLTLGEDEVRALSRFLEGLRCTGEQADPEIIRMQMVVRRFILAVSGTLGVNLTGDLTFYQDLSRHLCAVLRLSRPEGGEENPVVARIADDHPGIYRAVRLHQGVLEEGCGRALDRQELEYITVHICTAVERVIRSQRELSVILVSGAGTVTARLLYEKLSRQFRVCAVFSAHDLRGIRSQDADLIVSTLPLESMPIETVVISPLLTAEDSMRILDRAEALRRRWSRLLQPPAAEPSPQGLVQRVRQMFREESGQESSPLEDRVTKALRQYFGLEKTGDGTALCHLLTPEFIRTGVACRSWRQAVTLSARLLLERDYIDARYIDRIFDMLERNGPYMIAARGLLVAHASFRDGVNRMGMSLLRLAAPLDFGPEDYQKGIGYVCCLSPADPAGHLRALMTLTNLFEAEEWRQALDRAPDSRSLFEVICRYERGTNGEIL